CELEQPPDKVTAEIQAVLEPRQIFRDSTIVGPLLHHLYADQQGRQRRVQMVRCPRCHLSHAGELLDLQHALPPANALADIGSYLQKEDGSGGFTERQQAELNFERHSVLALAEGLDV